MNNWKEETFEVCTKPNEGEPVQYAVIHVLQLKTFSIPSEEVSFFMREKE